jgi:hypothetical protein
MTKLMSDVMIVTKELSPDLLACLSVKPAKQEPTKPTELTVSTVLKEAPQIKELQELAPALVVHQDL